MVLGTNEPGTAFLLVSGVPSKSTGLLTLVILVVPSVWSFTLGVILTMPPVARTCLSATTYTKHVVWQQGERLH